jgi:hypothetical protein
MLNIPMTCFVVSHNTSITAAATSWGWVVASFATLYYQLYKRVGQRRIEEDLLSPWAMREPQHEEKPRAGHIPASYHRSKVSTL